MRKFEGGLTQGQVNGINYILDSMEKDPFLKKVEHAAYMFATVKPETAHTYQPIHEYGGHKYFVKRYGSQTKVGKRLGNDTPEEGATYAGRGNVQLTGESNYEKAEEALRKYYPEIVAEFEARTGKQFDLTVGDQLNDAGDADIASDPAIAYAIMSYGMRTGMFTGRKLSDFDFNNPTDVRNARKIINGLDHADMIRGYYNRFLPILKQSLISGSSTNTAVPPADSTSLESDTADATVTPTNIETDVVQNADTIINEESLVDKASGLGDKFQSFQGVLDKFGFSVDNAKRSLGTVLLTWFKAIGSALMVVGSVLLDHWELLIIAALLAVLAYLLWERSGVRVAEAKAGIPVDVAKEMIKQENK